jgi:hypothetical protein
MQKDFITLNNKSMSKFFWGGEGAESEDELEDDEPEVYPEF